MKKSQKGFTIIEVALVLAIGALIFLVVFLAVPALQRNQRNDARHRDVSNIVTAVSSWVGNNPTGKLDDAEKANENQVTDAGEGDDETPIGAYLDTVSTNTETVEIKEYTGDPEIPTSYYQDASGNPVKITIVVGAQCDGTTKLKDGPVRSSAVVGSTETTGGSVPYCSSAN